MTISVRLDHACTRLLCVSRHFKMRWVEKLAIFIFPALDSKHTYVLYIIPLHPTRYSSADVSHTQWYVRVGILYVRIGKTYFSWLARRTPDGLSRLFSKRPHTYMYICIYIQSVSIMPLYARIFNDKTEFRQNEKPRVSLVFRDNF